MSFFCVFVFHSSTSLSTPVTLFWAFVVTQIFFPARHAIAVDIPDTSAHAGLSSASMPSSPVSSRFFFCQLIISHTVSVSVTHAFNKYSDRSGSAINHRTFLLVTLPDPGHFREMPDLEMGSNRRFFSSSRADLRELRFSPVLQYLSEHTNYPK